MKAGTIRATQMATMAHFAILPLGKVITFRNMGFPQCSVDVGKLVGIDDGVDAAHLAAVRSEVEDDDGEGGVTGEQQRR
ncbi:hypothetical protein [Micromonospora sp. NPDC050200]|uniref:hypothetical protein n=1 Tax=Micromonospora sp. NPDC050200 TaxID=3155664 RepID=UPI00340135E5